MLQRLMGKTNKRAASLWQRPELKLLWHTVHISAQWFTRMPAVPKNDDWDVSCPWTWTESLPQQWWRATAPSLSGWWQLEVTWNLVHTAGGIRSQACGEGCETSWDLPEFVALEWRLQGEKQPGQWNLGLVWDWCVFNSICADKIRVIYWWQVIYSQFS